MNEERAPLEFTNAHPYSPTCGCPTCDRGALIPNNLGNSYVDGNGVRPIVTSPEKMCANEVAERLRQIDAHVCPCPSPRCGAFNPCDDCAEIMGIRVLLRAARMAERERCAKIAEDLDEDGISSYCTAPEIAAKIRSGK